MIIASIKGLKEVDIDLVGPLNYFQDWAGHVLGTNDWETLRDDPIRVMDPAYMSPQNAHEPRLVYLAPKCAWR